MLHIIYIELDNNGYTIYRKMVLQPNYYIITILHTFYSNHMLNNKK